MHALRTAIFTAKGLKRFMKDGYTHHAKSYDAKCVPMRARGARVRLNEWVTR